MEKRRRGRPRKVFEDRELRKCLGCGKEFLSQGPWNRLCGECRKRARNYEETYSLEERRWL